MLAHGDQCIVQVKAELDSQHLGVSGLGEMLERLKGLFEGRDCLTDAARSSALVPACRGRGISAQVTNLEYRTFAAHLEDSHAAWRQDESVRRLEAELDQEQFPTQAVLPGREVHL